MSVYVPRLVIGSAQVTTAVYHAEDIDLMLVDDPIDDPIMLNNHLSDIVLFSFWDVTTTERVFFRAIY